MCTCYVSPDKEIFPCWRFPVNHWLYSIRIIVFCPLFHQVAALGHYMADSPLRDGHEAILLPGEMESQTKATRTAHGIPLAQGTYEELMVTAVEVGLSREEALHFFKSRL